MRIIFFYSLFFLIFSFHSVIAQKKEDKRKSVNTSKLVKEADKLFKSNNFYKAVKLYAKAADLNKSDLYANYMAGSLHLEKVAKPRALIYLERVYKINDKYRADLIYKLADSYRFVYNFDVAINYFIKYLEYLNMGFLSNLKGKIIPPDIVKKRIDECKYAKKKWNKPASYKLENLGNMINSTSPDYAPLLNIDETMMVFTSRRLDVNNKKDKKHQIATDGLTNEDIFISKKNPHNGQWGKAVSIEPKINTENNESAISISYSENLLYLYSDINKGDIYSTELISNSDSRKVIPLPSPINTNYKEHSFVVAPDGTYAILSSERPGGLGGLDLYQVEKERGQWVKVRNMGIDLNTKYNEISPFIHINGTILFFSSQGHRNMGGYDIFRSTYDSSAEKWKKPTNMGYPINTPDDDVYFIMANDGSNTAYLSSIREIGMGHSDIYKITMKDTSNQAKIVDVKQKTQLKKPSTKPSTKPIKSALMKLANSDSSGMGDIVIKLRLLDSETKEILPAHNVQLRHMENGTLKLPKVENGVAYFTFNNKKTEEFILTAQSDGYAFRSFIVKVPQSDPTQKANLIEQDVPLKKIKDGEKEILHNIYFKPDSDELLPSSYLSLNNLESMVVRNPAWTLDIIGHTDNLGTREYNQILSEKRARSVVDFLVAKGIEDSRLKAIGMGNSDPMASNDDEEEGRELNRRVEFKFNK